MAVTATVKTEQPKMCHKLPSGTVKHYFDVVDGKVAEVCRCGKMKRRLAV